MAEWDRGAEAGAASGFIVGTVVGVMIVVGFFLFDGKFWEGFLGISHSLVPVMALALGVGGFILFSLLGMVLGSTLGMIYAKAYARLPGKPPMLKGIALGVLSWLIVFSWQDVHADKIASVVDAVFAVNRLYPMMMYGALLGHFWDRLAQGDKKTFLRQLFSRVLGWRAN